MTVFEQIRDAICHGENIHPDILMGNTKIRKRELVFARQLIFYFMKEFTKESLSLIGSHMGGKDHATVGHAIKVVNNLIDTDKSIALKVALYKEKIKLILDHSYVGSMNSIKTLREQIEYCLTNGIEIPEEIIKRHNLLIKEGRM